jgi:hypothetical protein
MPTFVRSVPVAREPGRLISDELWPIALFCGIGLLVSLVAIGTGVEGVWF